MPSTNRKRTVKESATPDEHNVEVTDEVSNNEAPSSAEDTTEQEDERYTPSAG